MRVHHRRLILGVSAALAVAVLTAATAGSQAAQLGNFSAGPRVGLRDPGSMRTPTFNNGGLRVEPRLQRLQDHLDNTVVDDDGPSKGKGERHRPPKRTVHTGNGGTGSPPSARITIPAAGETRYVHNEVLLEFANSAGILDLLRRRGLLELDRQVFTVTNSIVVLARIANGRPVPVVLQSLQGAAGLRAAQANMLYLSSEDSSPAAPEALKATPAMAAAAAIPAGGDPAQYALAKLHIGAAHTLANGDRVLVAVIDSGIDMAHPDLAGAFAGSYDALGKAAAPHLHGTAIAGAIAAHVKLMGAAPAAKILAIRAFGVAGSSAEATTMAILKSVEYASVHQARIINMSFAGPSDPALAVMLAAVKAKGVVLIAASGNFGPKSPPQYPAADANVIAVSATDADDRLFPASNIGPHIAVVAPGVDILLPSPGNDFRIISGTSFSAAYVSGVVALMLQRAPGLSPDAVRKILQDTAKDLGTPGKDPEYGAGLVDAYAAMMAVEALSASAVTPAVGLEQAKAQ